MNRKVAIGCVVVIAIIGAIVAAGYLTLPKLIKKGTAMVKQAMAEEQRIGEVEKAWQPPSATPDASWFPSQIGEWKLERSEPRTGIPELKIDRPGQHATYRTGAGPIEVDVIPANDLEKETLLARAETALKEGRQTNQTFGNGNISVSVNSGSSNFTTTMGNRTHVRIGGDEHTRFWWVKGNLFVFRARGAADSETFPEKYLRAISPTQPAEPPQLERP
jgi:hypothetical protein